MENNLRLTIESKESNDLGRSTRSGSHVPLEIGVAAKVQNHRNNLPYNLVCHEVHGDRDAIFDGSGADWALYPSEVKRELLRNKRVCRYFGLFVSFSLLGK